MNTADLAQREFRKILLIKPSSPGDIIHALPVLRGLRRRYPQAHIAWLVANSFANLIDADPVLNEVILFDRKRFGRLGRNLTVTKEFVAFVGEIRERKFDLVIDLQGLFRSGFLAYASGAKVRIGFAAAREMSWMFYTHRIASPTSRDTHAADRNYAVAQMLGFSPATLDFAPAITDTDRQAAASLLRSSGISAPYAVFVPATRWETKCWPPDRYGRLAAALNQSQGIRGILVGGADDRTIGQIAADASGGTAINLCGRTSLRELTALVEGAAIVVTADSTPMHLAAALHRPLVALFGPTNPKRTGPYGRIADVLREDLPCSPCYLRRMSQCPYDHACMQRLSVEIVLAAAQSRLAAGAPVPVA